MSHDNSILTATKYYWGVVERERKGPTMLNVIRKWTASEKRALQARTKTDQLPAPELCNCTWTDEQGKRIIVNLLGTTKDRQTGLLAHKQGKNAAIWTARRDQSGAPGTWMWTEQQLEAAQKRSKRIRARIGQADRPIEVKPLFADRRMELLAIGCYEGYPDEEVIAKLEEEGFDTTLPENYRTTWNPFEQQIANTEPLLDVVKPQEQP